MKKLLSVFFATVLVLASSLDAHASDNVNRGIAVQETLGIGYEDSLLLLGLGTPCYQGLVSCGDANELAIFNSLAPCGENPVIACIKEVDASLDGQKWVTGVARGEMIPSWPMYSFQGSAEAGYGDAKRSNLYSFDGIRHSNGDLFEVKPRMEAVIKKGQAISLRNLSSSIRGVYLDSATQIPSGIDFGTLTGSQFIQRLNTCLIMDVTRTKDCWKVGNQPTGLYFKLILLLPQAPVGWVTGRLINPNVNFQSSTNSKLPFQVTMSGQSLDVPSLSVSYFHRIPEEAARWDMVRQVFRAPSWDGTSRGYPILTTQLTTYLRGAELDPEWNKATKTETTWRANLSWEHGSLVDQCPSKSFAGFVGSNALVYGGDLPDFDSKTGSLTYSVASPHYEANGSVAEGSYSLLLAPETAKCLWGFVPSNGSISLNVTDRDGAVKTATTSLSVDSSAIRFQATGFTFSKVNFAAKIKMPVIYICKAKTKGVANKPVPKSGSCPNGYQKAKK